MKLNSDYINFREGTKEDIKSLESLRLKSIENCNQYTIKQLSDKIQTIREKNYQLIFK